MIFKFEKILKTNILQVSTGETNSISLWPLVPISYRILWNLACWSTQFLRLIML